MKNQLKSLALLGALSALLIGVGGLLGPTYVYVFAALALAMNLGAYFYSDRIVLAMHHAEELAPAEAPGLHAMIEELAASAGVPKPRVYLIPDPEPNAFATGRNPEHGVVAVTAGILDLLDRRELRGVLAHEIAHIANRDILVQTIAAAITSAVTYVAHALSFAGLFGGGHGDDDEVSPLGSLLIALVAPFAAMLVNLGISRSREYLADETGARLCGDPEALASALLRMERVARASAHHSHREPATASLFIINPLSADSSLMQLFSTHPSTEERVARLRSMAATGGRGSAGWARRAARAG